MLVRLAIIASPPPGIPGHAPQTERRWILTRPLPASWANTRTNLFRSGRRVGRPDRAADPGMACPALRSVRRRRKGC